LLQTGLASGGPRLKLGQAGGSHPQEEVIQVGGDCRVASLLAM